MDYLSEYDPDWPDWFQRIKNSLWPQLTNCLRIEHVGSTSIAGMAAKPIIDIDLVVPNGAMPAAIASIVRAGYASQGDLGVTGREAFQPVLDVTQSLPPHHLYACEESALELMKHMSFREYLIAHPSEASRLTDLKRNLAFEQRVSRSEYIAAKSPLVEAISEEALAWYAIHHTA
jgi:GrpB-like predicted nucleotidyltransferase (UPF0157 family)